MGILNGNPQDEPLHSGEIYHLWSHLFATKSYLVTLQVLINHTGDKDLKALLEDFMENCIKQEEQQSEAILSTNGIRLPPAPPARPSVDVNDIPAGARFNDPEIAFLVQKEIVAGKLLCTFIMGIAIREDIAQMYGEFLDQKTEYEEKLLKMTKEKGWLVPPPLNIK
ncbi:DUF3231 family protein [Salirhabdus sp. Marseille-P4669]|uniref:DUF3231 family protein n=1 Tax=Salirhabdus sp. Marseille-P4669 TaxID=2042310 RepID=UPI000C7E6090|nr:DUF3231 family protein [Salirhabdus sp. Marseille-P4669]